MKNSDSAKEKYIRKTFGQRVHPKAEDIPKLQVLNTTLVTLWNHSVEQCNLWLAMPSEITGHIATLIQWQTDSKYTYIIQKKIEGPISNPEKRSITPISLNFWLTGARESTPIFEGVSVVLEREMLRRLAGGFSSYFALLKKKDARARPPAPKDPEKSFITLTWIEKSFSVANNKLSASIGSKQKVEFQLGEYIQKKLKELPQGSKLVQVTVSKRDGEFWANFTCNIPRPKPVTPKGIIAIDLGSGDIAFTLSNGREFSFKTRRHDKKWRKEIFKVEERAEKCQKGSRAWKRRMKARKTMHRKSLHQHTDHQRKLACWIAKQGKTVVVGKMKTRLGLSKSTGTPDQHWGVQNTGYAFRLLIFLREKMAEYGLTLLELDDPSRKGSLENSEAKFSASRELLQKGCLEYGVPFPSSFRKIEFSFPQG